MRNATLRQCAVVVRGLLLNVPESDGHVTGRPYLGWLLRELSRFGVAEAVLLTGELDAATRAALHALAAALPRPVSVVIAETPDGIGTFAALARLHDKLDDRILFCSGRGLFDGNLAALLADSAGDAPGTLARNGTFGGGSGYDLAVLDRRALAHGAASDDISRDTLPRLAAQDEARTTALDGRFLTLETLERDAAARADLIGRLHRPALFLDRDGTINVDHGYVATRERFAWIEAAPRAIARATAAGWHVFIVTNQSGVARGLYDEEAVGRLHDWLAEEVHRAGGTIDDVRYCPHHPEGVVPAYRSASPWRKPAPGMILDLIQSWELDRASCLMVGDQPTDVAAAAAAGVAGHLFSGGDLDAFVSPLLRSVRSTRGAAFAEI